MKLLPTFEYWYPPLVVAHTPTDETKRRNRVSILCVLAILNLISIADRYLLPDVQPLIQREFRLSDSAVGALSSAFFFVFMASMPVATWIGRLTSRKVMTCGAALVWSCLMMFSAMSKSYHALLINHALFAAGEASFAIFAPVVIAETFPAEKLHRVLIVFSSAVPLGTAVAFAMASLAHRDGWRAPLYDMAAVGLLAAVGAAALINDPDRRSEGVQGAMVSARSSKSLATSGKYLATVLGGCCLAFSMVGFAVWLPTLLLRNLNLPLGEINTTLSLITVATGVLGVILGGLMADYWLRRTTGALYLVSALSMLLAGFFGAITIFAPASLAFVTIAATQLCFFLNTAPMGAAILNSVHASLRAPALAGSMFIVHALGSGISPVFIGWIADHSSLKAGLAVALIPLGIGAIGLLLGAKAPLCTGPEKDHALS